MRKTHLNKANASSRRQWLFAGLAFCLLLAGCTAKNGLWEQAAEGQSDKTEKEEAEQGIVPSWMGPGLFSWSADAIEPEAAEELFLVMQEQGLTDLYQYFAPDLATEEIEGFLKQAQTYGISVYYLTGEPEWGLDPDGEEMCAEVKRVRKINRSIGGKYGFSGILMDTEPYLLEEWEDAESEVMESYVQAMTAACRQAQKAELPLIACIPFYYDSGGHEEALAQLLEEGCDGLAIMNYSKRDEAGHIETELFLAGQAEKPVTVIYELQEPGKYGLTDNNTYYEEGMDGVRESVEKLESIFGRQSFQFSLHEYKALLEVEGYE